MEIIILDEIEEFIKKLEKPTIAKVLRVIDLLETYGRFLGMPHVKYVHNNLWELRVRGKQEVRIIFSYFQGKIILLHGFLKKSQITPSREMDTASIRLRRLTKI